MHFIKTTETRPGVEVYSSSGVPIEYKTKGASGFDLPSAVDISIAPGATGVKVRTGVYVQLLPIVELQIRARSGIAAKTGLRISNGVGTVDSDYTGELIVLFDNIGQNTEYINKGDRIAQAVLVPFIQASLVTVTSADDFFKTERGSAGFGSTGV